MALPVRYGVSEHRIYVRLPAYNDACHFVDRADVALDVEGAMVGHPDIVRVAGVGLLISEALTPAGVSGAFGRPTKLWVGSLTTSSHQAEI